MLTERRVVTALRVFLVVLFGILVLLETLSLPGQFPPNATTLHTDLEAAI